MDTVRQLYTRTLQARFSPAGWEVFFTGMASGSSTRLQWKATHLRIYGQDKLDLMAVVVWKKMIPTISRQGFVAVGVAL